MALTPRNKYLRQMPWWMVLLLAAVGSAVVGGIVWLVWPSTYSATSSFFIKDQADLVAALAPETAGSAGAETVSLKPTPEKLSAILSSRLLRTRLVTEHDLAGRLRVDETEAEAMLAQMAEITPIGTEGFAIRVTCKGYSPVRKALGHVFGREEARLLCADLANSYLTELEEYVTSTTINQAKEKREFVQALQQTIDQDLNRTEAQLQSLQQEYQLLDPADKSAFLLDRMRALEQALAESLAEINQTTSALSAARSQLGREEEMSVAQVVEVRNPVISDLQQKLAQLQVDLATEEARGKTRQNRDVQQILVAIETTEEELAQVSEQVRQQVSRQANPTHQKLAAEVADLKIALAGAQARSRRLQGLLSEARGRLAELPPVARQYATLKQDERVQFETMGNLKQSLAAAMLEEQQSQKVGEFLVLDEAVPPPDLYGPPVWLAMAIVFLAILAVIGLGALNRMVFGG